MCESVIGLFMGRDVASTAGDLHCRIQIGVTPAKAIEMQASLRSNVMHIYEVRPRKDHRGVDLISDARSFGRLWYGEPNGVSNAIGYAQHYSRSQGAVIRVYDEAGNVIETPEHAGNFKEP